MHLRFLEFDPSEDTAGLHTWDALASPDVAHTPALLAEVQRLLAQLQALGGPGPLDDGHAWDMDLQIHGEDGQVLSLEQARHATQRLTLALCLSGGEALAPWLSWPDGA